MNSAGLLSMDVCKPRPTLLSMGNQGHVDGVTNVDGIVLVHYSAWAPDLWLIVRNPREVKLDLSW